MTAVLIVGGTGLTGAHAALYLQGKGSKVTLMSRTRPQTASLQGFPHIEYDYVNNDVPGHVLAAFDQMVFAAGADIRQLSPCEEEDAFFTRVNSEAIPAFFRSARDAGIGAAVYIGTYYPQMVPEAIHTSAYVKSRFLADEGVRALNSSDFRVCSLNAPFILGFLPGIDLPHLSALVGYGLGVLEGVPVVAPAGGVNHISSQSMSEAITAALERGEGGKAYLVGDENLSWKEYLEMIFAAAGNPVNLAVSPDEHPLFPDVILYGGRNAVIHYDADDSLGYSRNTIRATIEEVVEAFKSAYE